MSAFDRQHAQGQTVVLAKPKHNTNLMRGPSFIYTLHFSLDSLALLSNVFATLQPPFHQPALILTFHRLDPPGPMPNLTHDRILGLTLLPVSDPILVHSRDVGGGGLIDLDLLRRGMRDM